MAALFKHDAQGFLVGETVENGRDMLRIQQQGMKLWKDIRADVKAIAGTIGAKVANDVRMSRPNAVVAQPRSSSGARLLGGNYVGRPVALPAGRSAPQRSGSAGTRTAISVAVTQPRGANGRFVAGASKPTASAGAMGRATNGRWVAGQPRPGSDGASSGGAAGEGSAYKTLSDNIGRLTASLNGADNLDPTLAAAKEITDVVSPLGRGLFSIFGRSAERRKESWYRRILKAVTPGSAKPAAVVAGGGGAGIFGALGGVGAMLGSIPALLAGVLTKIFMPIVAIWGSWELGQWIGKKIYDWLSESGIMAKVFDAFDVIGQSFSTAWDGVKSGVDTVVTGIQTTWKTITDGFKTALDSFMEFPKKIGEFFGGLDAAMRNIPMLGKSLGAMIDSAKSTLTDAKSGYQEGRAGNTAAPAASAAQAIARDVGKGVAAASAIGSQAGAGFDAARNGGTNAPAPTGMLQRIARGAGGMAGILARRWNGGAKNDIVGAANAAGVDAGTLAQIAHFESGFNSDAAPIRKDGTRISTAHGYGQFLDGTWTDVLNKHGGKYGVAGAGSLTKEQAGKLRGDTKLQAAMLAEFTKENVTKGRANGGKDDAANVYAYHNLGDGDAKRLLTGMKADPNQSVRDALIGGRSVSEKERARIESVISGNKSLYGDGSISASAAYGRMGEKMRAGDAYAADARASAGIPVARAPGAIVGAANLPSIPSANVPSSVPSEIPRAPEVREPPDYLNTGAGAGRGDAIRVSIPEQTGQNVGDRGIAHIVGGGLGGK